MGKRSSFQRGRIEVRKRDKGDVFTILYWVRDLESSKGWKLKRETLPDCKSRKDANKTLVARIAEVNADNNNSRQRREALTFDEFTAGLWRDYLRNTEVKPSTRYSYDSMLKNHILPALGKQPMREITPQDLTRFFNVLRGEAAPKYLLNIYGVLNTIFEVAAEHEVIDSIPLRRKLHRPKHRAKEKAILPVETLREILSNIADPHKPLFILLMATGARIGEVLALRWQNVDFESQILTICHNIWRREFGTPKTEASIRGLHLPEKLANVLLYHRAKSPFTQPDDLMFSRLDGSPLDPDHLRECVLYPAMNAVGIERAHREYGFHIFRHTAGSILYGATGDPKLAQKTLGHSRSSTTMDIYVHMDAKAAEKGTEVLVREIMGESNLFLTDQSEQIQ